MSYPSVILSQSPTSYWRMGDAANPVVDVQGAHDGTAGAGGTFGSSGAIAGDDAMSFSGTTTVVSTSGWSFSSSVWSASALVRNISPAPTTFHTGVFGLTIGSGAQTERALVTSRRNATNNRFSYWDNTNTWFESSVTVALDAYCHLAAVKNGTSLKLYHNGFEVGSFTVTDPADTYTNVYIGGSQSTGTDAMKGEIDEAAVWAGTALTPAQVAEQWAAWQAVNAPVTRRAVATTAPAAATSFTPNLPTHDTGDRLVLMVLGKYNDTTVPTVNNGWTLVGSGTGGTGATGNDVGQTFWAAYAIDATSSSQAAPTVTPGATAPNSWESICVSYTPGAGMTWKDAIVASAPWVASGSDTTTTTPLTAGATLTNQPSDGDALAMFGVIPTDLGSAIGASSATGTGLSGGVQNFDTYVENALGADTASVHGSWTGFTGTASGAITPSFAVTSATNLSGNVVVAALRQQVVPIPPLLVMAPRTY